MGTIWEWIRNRKLRSKLTLLYTVAFTLMLGIAFLSIYSISENNRREEFYKRLSDRTVTTFTISIRVDQINNDLLRLFDKNTINSLSDERVLLFDSSGRLIYSTVDLGDTRYATEVLNSLKTDESAYRVSEDKYEMLGLKFKDRGHTYYGIARAYDKFGKRKIHFLALLLSGTFIIAAVLFLFLSFYLSNIITNPITRLTKNIEKISPDDLSNRVPLMFADDEIGFLANKFNELLDKVENAFKFQVHYIHHISHELKTPLAVMMANAERALTEDETEKLKSSMQFQKNGIMELSHIINAMLDISKMEKKLTTVHAEAIRVDEVIFDCIEEISMLNSGVCFDFNIDQTLDEGKLTIMGNSRMVKMAILNLIKNAVNFSADKKPGIAISATNAHLVIRIFNDGDTLTPEEQVKLFRHSFRGRNSILVKGFGLGLVLASRVIKLHDGSLEYSIIDGKNCFALTLPLTNHLQ